MKKSNYECELAKGVYLSNHKTERPNEYKIEVTGSPYNENFYMSFTDEMDKYITTTESTLREICHKLFSDNEVNPEDLFWRIADMLAYRHAPIEGTKYKKDDGTFTYRMRDCNNMPKVPFLHKQDLSFENPEDLEKIKSYQGLEWPDFSADQTELAQLLETKGYPVKHYGRSGFESRNRYCIELPDIDEEDIIDVINKINQDIDAARKELELKKLAQVDQQFLENVYDEDGIFSYVIIGGGPQDPQDYDHNKYISIETVRISNCQDHRRNISHEYSVTLYDEEKLTNNTKKVIELKGGYCRAFEELSVKYNLMFKFNNYDSYTYVINGKTLQNVSHLDLDLNNPEDVKKALMQDSLSWPSINATNKILKEELEKMGYVLEYSGRSGFESRNSYIIKTKDGILTPEVSEQITKDLEQAKQAVKRAKLVAFDEYFDAQSTDKSKVYSLVETGYNYDLTRIIDEAKYERVAQICVGCTQDHRRGYDHTYQELLINKERIKEDKRKFIVLEVPKEMIGKIIGKGGSNIKALQQKFGKHFSVVQDPKEIAAEKKKAEEERARQHRYDLQKVQNNIRDFMGENFLSSDDDSIAVSMVEYITNNQSKLPVSPTQDELQQMKENLIKERDEEIARENRRKAEEIERQKWLEEQRIAEQKRLEQEKTGEITQTIKTHINSLADANDGKIISNEDFIKFTNETYKEDELAQKLMSAVQKDFLLKLEEERAMQKRFAEAEKNFDKIAAEEFKKFFADDEATEGYGEEFFYSIFMNRRQRNSRYDKYKQISDNIARQLGIYDDLQKRPEERILKNWPQQGKIGHGDYPKYDFSSRVQAFEEAHREDETFSKPIEPQEPIKEEPAQEPTIENLAALWGAKTGKIK